MHFEKALERDTLNAVCPVCDIPLDAEYFDESGIAPVPQLGEDVVLARFTLHPQYCGVLINFSQYTDLYGKDNSQIETPGLEWLLLMNNRPLFPYLKLDRIVNPWGYGSFPVSIRLDENARIEFVVRNVSYAPADLRRRRITRVGGRDRKSVV